MRIHTDKLTATDFAPHRYVSDAMGTVVQRGSRSKARAFDLYLYATERAPYRRTQTRDSVWGGPAYSLAWDEWGMILAALFELDPDAIMGPYVSREHYHWVTGNRFAGGPVVVHGHRWQYQGKVCTGTYAVQYCEGCGAIQRNLSSGVPFEAIA